MPEARKKSYFCHFRFQDFDDFADTLREWDLEVFQLRGGKCRADLLQFGVGNLQVGYAYFSNITEQRGVPPKGLRTFAILVDPASNLIWRRREINENTLMAFPPDDGVDVVTKGGCDIFSFSLPEQLLGEVGLTVGVPNFKDLLCGRDVVTIDPSMMQRLRRFLFKICCDLTRNPPRIETPSLQYELEFELPRQLHVALASPQELKHRPSVRLRDLALKKAEEYIAESKKKPLTVRDLCQVTGITDRTLQYAYLERYGVSPKAYLQAFRLNHVRRELRNSDPSSTKIADVARRWGFSHLGQFATDYRRLFEELPSETLGKTGRLSAKSPCLPEKMSAVMLPGDIFLHD
jgi:AraC-like DNA-binding protein